MKDFSKMNFVELQAYATEVNERLILLKDQQQVRDIIKLLDRGCIIFDNAIRQMNTEDYEDIYNNGFITVQDAIDFLKH